MAIKLQGYSGTIADVDGTRFRAQKITFKPTEYSTGGHYSMGAASGIIPAALTTPAELFQFRWSSSSLLGVVQRVRLSAAVSTTFFAAGVPLNFLLQKSTSWSANGTGGTSITPDVSNKQRTSMASSVLGDFRIATTAALGAGTKTLETLDFAAAICAGNQAGCDFQALFSPGIAMQNPAISLFEANVANGMHPLVLAQNEGFSLVLNAVPATGTWQFGIDVQWAEVAQY
jgi:hypothetical protein